MFTTYKICFDVTLRYKGLSIDKAAVVSFFLLPTLYQHCYLVKSEANRHIVLLRSRYFGHWTFTCQDKMSFTTLLLESLGSLFICIIFIVCAMNLFNKLNEKCFQKSSPLTSASSSNNHARSQRQAVELLPPPTYDELFPAEIFVIHIEGVDEKLDGYDLHDENLPTYDDVMRGILPV